MRQFNIIQAGKRYYAVAQSEGAFDTAKADAGGYTLMFAAGDLPTLKTMVRDGLNQGFGNVSTMLVEQGYRDTFNIIRSHAKYYALAQDEGAFDYEKAERGGYRRMFVGTSLADLKQKVH